MSAVVASRITSLLSHGDEGKRLEGRGSRFEGRGSSFELDPLPSTLFPRPSSRDPLPSTLFPRPSSLDPLPSTLFPRPSSLVQTHGGVRFAVEPFMDSEVRRCPSCGQANKIPADAAGKTVVC